MSTATWQAQIPEQEVQPSEVTKMHWCPTQLVSSGRVEPSSQSHATDIGPLAYNDLASSSRKAILERSGKRGLSCNDRFLWLDFPSLFKLMLPKFG